MRNSIEVGDGITTIGGIVGRVASIKAVSYTHLDVYKRQHQRRAAGRIQLVMVMLFDDLYVEICPQHSVGLFGELDEQIDAQRHVRTLEHRYGV